MYRSCDQYRFLLCFVSDFVSRRPPRSVQDWVCEAVMVPVVAEDDSRGFESFDDDVLVSTSGEAETAPFAPAPVSVVLYDKYLSREDYKG